MFDIRRGGDLVVDTMILNIAGPGASSCAMSNTTRIIYEIRTLKVDNNATGWRLIEMQKPRSVRLHVSGHMCRRAIPGADAIKLLGDPNTQDVEVDLWWHGQTLAGK